MFVRVDEADKEPIEGFSYFNLDGDEEQVALCGNCVNIVDSMFDFASVYVEDIPKLIKALQAAYDHIQKGK